MHRQRSVIIELLNEDEIYRANLKGEVIPNIYKVTFYQYGTPLAHWPIDGNGLNDLVINWIIRGQRPH